MNRPETPGGEGAAQGQAADVVGSVGQSERWLSAILGGLLLVVGARRGVRGTVLGCAAGALLFRATTGWCACYMALGVGTGGRPGRATVPTTRTAAVAAPRAVVIRDIVEEASEESFPASDAPAFTGIGVGSPRHR